MISVKEALRDSKAEVIVVDNGSKDQSCKMIKDRFAWVRLIENEQNIGLSRANNQGANQAKGEYVCFLNPDIVVGSRTFSSLLDRAKRLPNLGILGPRLIDGKGRFLNDSKRNIPSPLTSLQRLLGVNFGSVKNYYAKHIPSEKNGYVDVLSGSFLLIKKKAFDLINGFDEDFFLCCEDIDLCYRMKKKGFQNYYIGDTVAIHYRAESIGRNEVYVKQFYNAMRIFYKKHFQSNWLFDVLISIAIQMVASILRLQKRIKKSNSINQYYLISEDARLKQKLKAILSQKIKKISRERLTNLGDQNIEIIFDNNFIAFDDIIDCMQKNKNNRITYKIRPQGSDYIVGSDFNDGKGEVIWL